VWLSQVSPFSSNQVTESEFGVCYHMILGVGTHLGRLRLVTSSFFMSSNDGFNRNRASSSPSTVQSTTHRLAAALFRQTLRLKDLDDLSRAEPYSCRTLSYPAGSCRVITAGLGRSRVVGALSTEPPLQNIEKVADSSTSSTHRGILRSASFVTEQTLQHKRKLE
jgi:hypothetical protein